MKASEVKADRERLLSLRGEVSTLRWEIDKAVNKSYQEGAIFRHKYHDTWDIIHPKSGEPFKAHSHWFNSFGTDEQKEMMEKRRKKIIANIHADKRQRCGEIDKEIEEIYEKYRCLWKDLDSYPFEGRACDGESDLADILWVAQYVLERKQVKCFLDGNALCIVGDNFLNLQESKAMFIEFTPEQIAEFEALDDE